MAFDWSKINFLSKLDARSRVFVLFGGIVGVGVIIYVLVSFLSSDSATVGPSKVASAPRGLESVPGGKLTPEYYRALQQANKQAAQQAQISGSSAVPTLINVGQQSNQSGDCTVLCGDESINVADTMGTWVRQGKLSPDTAKRLNDMAKGGAPISDYAAMLDQLVRDGKLTPEQARKLLEQYRKQHANQELKKSAATMDAMIKSGKLSIADANALLEAQKSKLSPDEYAAMLQQMVRDGKIDQATAQRLLNEYMQQRAKEIIAGSITSLRKMAAQGQITPDVLSQLIPLEESMVPVSQYQNKLNELVTAGQLTPAVADKILAEFKEQKRQIGTASSIDGMLSASEEAAYQELRDLLAAGQISKETAAAIGKMIQEDVTFQEFAGVIDQLVKGGQLTPEISKLKLADYRSVKGFRDLQSKLQGLQDSNASAADYEAALREAVAQKILTPEQAAQLMREYQENKQRLAAAAAAPVVEGDGAFAKLQQRLNTATAETTTSQQVDFGEPTAEAFSTAQLASQEDLQAARAERIKAMAGAMAQQAQQLVSSWQPPSMEHKQGDPCPKDSKCGGEEGAESGNGAAAGSGAGSAMGDSGVGSTKPVLVKAGDIIFAVLDTAVNSDYPDSPVMATVVLGKFKGAKMLGKLVTTKGVSGQLDRVTLNFTLMNRDSWPKSLPVTAYAIDPDTARTVLASSVNYHYMLRFGAIMATSFVEGYAKAINSSGGTTTTGIFGTSSTNPELSPAQKFASAIGQIGTALSDVTKKYMERPPTVKVNAGVGLGILFMQDVSDNIGTVPAVAQAPAQAPAQVSGPAPA